MELGTDETAVAELTRNPVMLAEAQRALHSFRVAVTSQAGEEGVRRVIGRRLVTYPQARMSDAQWAAWWQDFFDVCAGVSESALESGMAAWVADPASQFMPKPGKLKELALSTPNRHVRAYDRIAAALRISREAAVQPKERVSADQVADMLKDYRASIEKRAAIREEKRARPPVQAAIDETGISPAMREALERQRGAA